MMFVLLSQVAYIWLQGVGIGYVPMIGVHYPVDEAEHGDMTVLRSCGDRGADVTPVSSMTVQVEAFPDRLDCPDAMGADDLNNLAYQTLWRI